MIDNAMKNVEYWRNFKVYVQFLERENIMKTTPVDSVRKTPSIQ